MHSYSACYKLANLCLPLSVTPSSCPSNHPNSKLSLARIVEIARIYDLGVDPVNQFYIGTGFYKTFPTSNITIFCHNQLPHESPRPSVLNFHSFVHNHQIFHLLDLLGNLQSFQNSNGGKFGSRLLQPQPSWLAAISKQYIRSDLQYFSQIQMENPVNLIFKPKIISSLISFTTVIMKAPLLIATILIASALAQGPYVIGGTSSLNLPTTPRSGFDSTSSSTATLNVNVPAFPQADLTRLTVGTTTSGATTSANIANTIKNAKTELSTPVRSIESLFSRFPSKAELDKFADDGDTAAILKTINTVASDDSVPCGTKISYLLELLGSVKAAIQRKSLFVDQLVSIIDGAKAEITRLQGEIARIQGEREFLRIPDIQRKIADLVARLEVLYNQINAIKTQIPPEEARIAGYQKEIATYNKQSDDERNRISNDKLKLAQTINSISDLQNKLKELRGTRAALENSISNSESLIRENNAKVSNMRNTIADINAKIKNLQDSIDRIKRDSNALEVDLERSRTDLSVAQVKDKKFADDIKGLKDRIVVEQAKVVEDDLQKLRVIVDKLGKSYPTIQAGIDREYYYCYGPGKVQVETTGSTVVYIVNGDAFGQYIDNAYGQVTAPGLRTSTTGSVRLQSVDPFSPIWTSKFGISSSSGKGSVGGSGRGNFSCLSGSAANGRGVITSLTNEGIQINDANGKPVSLNIGACTRVESTTSLPRVGQNVAWRGSASTSGGFDLFSVTCW